jgi:hypothetical protein
MATKTTLKEFEAVFPKLEEDLLNWAKSYNLPQQYLEWYKKVRWISSLSSRHQIHPAEYEHIIVSSYHCSTAYLVRRHKIA